MPKYLCVQRNQPGGDEEQPSPARMEELYAKFNAWKERYRDNFLDLGGKLGGGRMVTEHGAMDGPLVEAKEVIGGYMVLTARSLEEAIEIARACPGLVGPGSGVEVREIRTP
jgi:hypothetical protein